MENSNSPADDHWELAFSYTPISDIIPITLYITFLSNSSIDLVRTLPDDLAKANTLLEPAIQHLQFQTNMTFDFWELINWMFVSFYWTVLSDFGQIAPLSAADNTTLPSTNNIFINPDLFQIYASYLNKTVTALLNNSLENWTPDSSNIVNLTEQNTINATDTTIYLSYSCVERRRKSPLNFVISIISADYPLIHGPYVVIIWIAAALMKRRRRDCKF